MASRYGAFWSAKTRNKRTLPAPMGAAMASLTVVIDKHGGFE